MQSHRVDAPPWVTTDILEEGDGVRVTVQTAQPERAEAIAQRIVNQRRAQGWRVIEVAVQDADGQLVDLVTSTAPHHAATLRDD
jgi:hypothetical protein